MLLHLESMVELDFFWFKNEPKKCLITSKFMKFTYNKLQKFR